MALPVQSLVAFALAVLLLIPALVENQATAHPWEPATHTDNDCHIDEQLDVVREPSPCT